MIETVVNHQEENKDSIVIYKDETYTYFDEGLTRTVWVNEDKTKVIKFLHDDLSFDFNKEESDIYESAGDNKITMAKTKYANGVIEQEFCNPIKWDNRELTIRQSLFAASCREEVGWNSKGDLVCFDLNEYCKY